MVDLFRPTSMSFNFTPTISSSGGIVDVLGPIFKHPITTNSISCKSQQYTTFNLVMGGVVASWRPISTSPLNINSCYLIARGRLAGLLWPRSTSIIISYVIIRGRVDGRTLPTSTTSTINWGILNGLLKPMSTNLMTYIITWVIVAGIKRHMSTTFLTCYTSINSPSELALSVLRRREEEWLVLKCRDPRLPLPLIMNNNLSASRYFSLMNGFRKMFCGNWTE